MQADISRPSAAGLFITGTDTGVGKTAVTAALAGALRAGGIDVAVMKPLQTGSRLEEGMSAPDAEFCARLTGPVDSADACPIRLAAPLAPLSAAELAGEVIDLQRVWTAFRRLQARHQVVLAEGAGGLAVPIRTDYLMADLARDLGLPLLIVARPALGTINHTLLTVAFARSRDLPIAGIVMGDWPEQPGLAERTAPEVIERITGIPILARFDHDPRVDTETNEPGGLADSEPARRLARAIWPGMCSHDEGATTR